MNTNWWRPPTGAGAEPQRDLNRRPTPTSEGPATTPGPNGPGGCGSYSSPAPTVFIGRTNTARPHLWRRCMPRAPDSGGPRKPGCPPGPVSVPGPRRAGMSGPAARTWLRLQGAGRRRADTPELRDMRSGLGSRAPTLRVQPEPERPPYRAASALPARGKGATGFPGRTSRASGLARVPRARENRARKGSSAYLRANAASLPLRCVVTPGRQKRKLWGRTWRPFSSPSLLLPERNRKRREFLS